MTTLSRRALVRVALAATLVPLALLPSGPADARPTCDGLPATIVGTDGNDTIVGTPRRDVIAALLGSDTVSGGGGNDVICGGYGADRLTGGLGDDRIFGGPGLYKDDRDGPHILNDWLRGGPGDDRLVGGLDPRDLPAPLPDIVDYSNAIRGMTVDLTLGTAKGQGADRLSIQAWYVRGSDYADTIIGGDFADHLSGGLGADTIEGRAGADIIVGDVIGPEGDDAPDVLRGQRGADYVAAFGGEDTLYGGPGDDELRDEGTSVDRIYGLDGDDWISDSVVPAEGQVLQGGAGRNRLDLVTKSLSGTVVQVPGVLDLGAGLTTVSWTPEVVVTTSGFTTVRLPDGDWTAYGTDADEYFWEAYVGPRTIYARGGDDYLGGSDQDDYLHGGTGTDRALPERGVDTCVSIEEVVAGECEK